MTLPADQVTPTGYAPFSTANPLDTSVYGFLPNANGGQRISIELRVRKLMRKPQMRALARVMHVLTGAVAGSLAQETKPQVASQDTSPTKVTSVTDLGGVRAVNTVNLINRNSVASDTTYIQGLLTQRNGQAIASYPADASGNGGGGKVNTHSS